MGRRSLPHIDPSLDLSRHYLEGDSLPHPFDRQPLFSRVAPLEIEVGSGKGLFLTAASAACPERDFLGIELAPQVRSICRCSAGTPGSHQCQSDLCGCVAAVRRVASG